MCSIMKPTFKKQKYNLEHFRNVKQHSYYKVDLALIHLLPKDRAKYTVIIQN